MEEPIKLAEPDNFSHIANVLTVIGFVITTIGFLMTVYVFVSIKKIKSFYVFKVRVPDLLEKLSEHSSQLLEYNNFYEESIPEILLEIGQVEVTLKSLKKKVTREVQKSIGEINKRIVIYKTTPKKEQLWDVYVCLQQVNQEITYLQEDQQWETK